MIINKSTTRIAAMREIAPLHALSIIGTTEERKNTNLPERRKINDRDYIQLTCRIGSRRGITAARIAYR